MFNVKPVEGLECQSDVVSDASAGDSLDGANPVMPRLALIMVPVMWHCFTLIVDDAIVSFSEQLIMRHCLRCSDEMILTIM